MTDTAIPFRSAPAPSATETATPPQKSDPSPTSQSAKSDTNDAPPSLYKELEKKPYAVKYLNLELYHDDESFQDVRHQAEALDNYVNKQIKARGLKDSQDSYKEVIDAIYKQIGKSSNEDPTKSLRRLSVAAKAIARLETAKLPPILSARSLSPSEFEEVQP